MFGLSKTSNNQKNSPSTPAVVHDIAVIPDLFYGGNDPDIYVEKTAKPTDVNPSKKTEIPEKKVHEQKPEVVTVQTPIVPRMAPKPLPVPDLPSSSSVNQVLQTQNSSQKIITPRPKSKFVLVLVLLLFLLLGLGVGGWYYYSENVSAIKKVVVTPTPPLPKPLPVVVPPVVETVSTSTLSTSTIGEPTVPTSTIQRERSLPPISLTLAPDSDNDKLSTAEEEVFQVDPEVWDTDGDGYYDGQEVYNLYNPKGIAPMKIIDSGLVQEYVNPQWQYRIYYPTSWQATAIDERTGDDVLFNSITGDYIQVKSYKKISGETFPQWFGRVVSDQMYTDLLPQKNRFSISYLRRKDGLVSYFDTPNAVYLVIYYSHEENKNDFVHIMDMMVQSFRTTKVNIDLPVQAILPIPVNTGVVTSTLMDQFLQSSRVTSTSSVSSTSLKQ